MKKMISWNVNGLRACVTKGFLDFFKEIDADIFCLQETKLSEGQIELDLLGYYDYWNYADKSGAEYYYKKQHASQHFKFKFAKFHNSPLNAAREANAHPAAA